MKSKLTLALTVIAMMMAVCVISIPSDVADAEAWDGTTANTDWYNPESESYAISTAAELAGLASLVNQGYTFEGKTISLADNINLDNRPWTPIGTSDKRFQGTFAGTNYTISNLYINNTNLEYAGLFGVVTSASITDVTIENVNLTAKASVGALAGSAYPGTVSGCKVTGDISITGYYKVGGLIGEGYADIQNCSISGSSGSKVTGTYDQVDFEGDNVGGLIGYRGEGANDINNCDVSGITVDGTRKVGGLVGSAFDDNNITECSVTGVTIYSSATEDYILAKQDSIAIGGIIGLYTHNGNGNGELSGCTAQNIKLTSVNSGVTMNYIAGGQRGSATVEPVSDTVNVANNRLIGDNTGATSISFIRDGNAYPTIEAALDGVNEDVTLYIPGGKYGMFQTSEGTTFEHSVTFRPVDGEEVTIEIIPASGCKDSNTHTCEIDKNTHNGINEDYPMVWNTPERIQEPNAQYHIFSGFTDVAFSNMDFVFVPTDFTLCLNNQGWEGFADADKVRNGEFQFGNTGDLSFNECYFDKVIVSPYSCRGTTTVTQCTFTNVYDAYALKDIYSENAVIEGCKFTDCGGAIYFEGDVSKGEYSIRNNVFTNIDSESCAATDKVGTRGLIQFSAAGDYGNALITVEGNRSSGDAAVFRQLNKTVTPAILDTERIAADNDFEGEMFTDKSVVVDLETVYLDTTAQNNGDGSADSPFNNFSDAMNEVKAGETIKVSGELKGMSGIDKPVTIQGSGDDPIIVSGELELPDANGTVRFINLSFTGGNCISEYKKLDRSNLSLVFEGCSFNNSGHPPHTLYIQAKIHSLTLENCDFLTIETQQMHSYLVWTYQVDELTVRDCYFQGNGNVRGAIHPGDGTEVGTKVTVENTVFDGYERGLNIAFTNEGVHNEVTVTNCKFYDIEDNPIDTRYDENHVATVYIHADQKPGTTTITYADNIISGGSGRVFFSNSPTMSASDLVDESRFNNNFLNGNAITELESVCLDPWVAKVDGYGYETLESAVRNADDRSTVILLEDVTVSTRIDITTDITLDLQGFEITASDGFAVTDGLPYLITVESASAVIQNGTLKTGSDNSHGLNVYGGDALLKNLTIDVRGSGVTYNAPLIVNASDVTLGDHVTFWGGTYYSINLDSNIDGVDKVSLTTETNTTLGFYGVPLGIYNQMGEGQTAAVNFGAGTVYYYDAAQFVLLASDTESTESIPNDATDSKREYDVTFDITPPNATVTVYQDEMIVDIVSGNGVVGLIPGKYTFVATSQGYEDCSGSFEVRGATTVSATMDESTTEPEQDPDPFPPFIPGDDDDVYIPPTIVVDESSSDDNDAVKIAACAAAAVAAAILAVLAIALYRKD